MLVPLTYWSTTNGPARAWTCPGFQTSCMSLRKPSSLIITYGFPALLCYGLVFLKRPFLFGIGIAALLMTVVVSKDLTRDIVHRERSFFGVLTVTRD